MVKKKITKKKTTNKKVTKKKVSKKVATKKTPVKKKEMTLKQFWSKYLTDMFDWEDVKRYRTIRKAMAAHLCIWQWAVNECNIGPTMTIASLYDAVQSDGTGLVLYIEEDVISTQSKYLADYAVPEFYEGRKQEEMGFFESLWDCISGERAARAIRVAEKCQEVGLAGAQAEYDRGIQYIKDNVKFDFTKKD